MRNVIAVLLSLLLTVTGCTSGEGTADPLSAWNDVPAKTSITEFVERVTTGDTPDFVEPEDRIAVFDNDGTLWAEAPLPFQAAFVIDELKRRAPQEPALAADPMVQAALNGDVATLLAGDRHEGLLHVLALTHTGMTTGEFDQAVTNWLARARHPRFDRPYDQLTYAPQQQLLSYLRDNGFRTYIVSGGGADFMRVFSQRVYGIPPEQVVGSTGTTRYELRDGKPVLVKTLDYVFVDDKAGKPSGIHEFIGRRPILAVGNSDGDQAMLEYTTIDNPLPSLGVLVHHTDAEREYAYDADPPASGKLVTALQEAGPRGWTVVDMKNDWNTVFAQ
ncbi:haloacid dehalogenase-like hydrolase [Mycobacterium sp. TNTM28]|uniref:Haloacid dehalogenase-like hydrolase n=1 Tax=[Mycobacterium] fortunisiensis TaxID=2600579 RepID=A0ABS6KH57_9MYCO|nr:HAD family hydrolase [[Mycobacterium] fortunisiensis]MBU9762898.1 haloacid dehalogenase-like hydrolase [[Mycobacterium] fortunisiensis]